MSTFKLSTVQPDYEQINQQLTSYLSGKQSWASVGNSKTGTLLIDAISAIGSYDQYSVWSAVNETTLENAVLPESIYCNNLYLGNRLNRTTPATVQVTLQNTDYSLTYIEIPRFTQFSIEGVDYFNREAIIFDSTSYQQTVNLYQGTIESQTFSATGQSFQSYILESTNQFEISDTDIICFVDGAEYTRTTDAIFTYSGSDSVFYENSTQQGYVKCLFGDGIYGMIPSAGSLITFTYAISMGASGNNTAVNQRVTCQDFPSLVGESLTNPSGGGDPNNLTYYRELGSQSAAANGRGISRNDIRAVVCRFPGIKDCRVYCQAEIAPLDKDWMNVIGLLLLTDDSFNQYSWKNLVSYLDGCGICGFQYKWFQAEKVNATVNATVYLKKGASLTESKNQIEAALRTYFEPKIGSLGRSFYKTDLEDIILSTVPTTIDYADKIEPTIDLVINQNQYINLESLQISCKYSQRDTQYWVNPLNS